MLSMPTRLVLPLLALTAACTFEVTAPDALDDLTLRDCPLCGMNSPAINGFQFPELHLGGLPNSDGVRLIGLHNPGDQTTYQLGVDTLEQLVALDGGGNRVASGPALVGWLLVLEKDSVTMNGHIVAVDNAMPSWFQGGPRMTAYAIAFAEGNVTKNVCPTYFNSPWAPVLTIIRGETYDRVHKVVDLVDSNWATFACADQAAYKAKLLGYDQTIKFAATGQPATIDQQNATLKMVTADYCGDGTSYTEQGTELHWQNTALTVTAAPGDMALIEAVWTGEGALCLDNPRHATLEEVQAECDLPSCATIDLDQVPHEWITWAPASD